MWIKSNPNSCGKYVGDCVIRALSIIFEEPWDKIYCDLCVLGLELCDMPSANHVWGRYLESRGFVSKALPFDGRRLAEIASGLKGKCILATGDHVVAVIDGNYHDAWDSGNEVPLFVWKEK